MLYYNEVPKTTLKVVRTTIISPGTIDTELTEGISGVELNSAIDEDMKIAIEPASIARAIAFAINNHQM